MLQNDGIGTWGSSEGANMCASSCAVPYGPGSVLLACLLGAACDSSTGSHPLPLGNGAAPLWFPGQESPDPGDLVRRHGEGPPTPR